MKPLLELLVARILLVLYHDLLVAAVAKCRDLRALGQQLVGSSDDVLLDGKALYVIDSALLRLVDEGEDLLRELILVGNPAVEHASAHEEFLRHVRNGVGPALSDDEDAVVG